MRLGGVIDQGQKLCTPSPEDNFPACGAEGDVYIVGSAPEARAD